MTIEVSGSQLAALVRGDAIMIGPTKRVITLDDGPFVVSGGPGSGHRGHAGRPGEVGGSLPGTSLPTEYDTPEIREQIARGRKLGVEYILGPENSADFLAGVWQRFQENRVVPPPDILKKMEEAGLFDDTYESVRNGWYEKLAAIPQVKVWFVEKVMKQVNQTVEDFGIENPPPVLIRWQILRDDNTAAQYFGDKYDSNNAYIGIWQSNDLSGWHHLGPDERDAALTSQYFENSIQGTYIHEYGHHELDNNSKFANAVINAEVVIETHKNEVRYNISDYAVERPVEMAAEAYSIYRHPRYDEFPERARQLIEHILFAGDPNDDPFTD